MNINFLKSLLYSSGEILKDGFGLIQKIDAKQDQSNVVTEYDFKSESYIRDEISNKYPEHNILGEEKGFEDQGSEYTWVIDPLDGTSNFASSIPWFGILIALLKNNTPVLAGAYLPLSDELYYASEGGGTFKNDNQIFVTKEQELKNLLCCYSLDFNKDIRKTEKEVDIIKNLVQSCRNLRSTNSLVDFCFVAEGKFGATINQSMKIWDIAAPELLLKEAGAKITDASGNQIQYTPSSQSTVQNYTAVAANPFIHARIMELMQ